MAKQRSPSLGTANIQPEPLVSLTKTVVECRPESRLPSADRRSIQSLSSQASCFFDLQSFPSSVDFSPPRNQFEELFNIPPPLNIVPYTTTRIVLEDPIEPAARSGLFTAPAELVMSLRKYSDDKAGFDFGQSPGSSGSTRLGEATSSRESSSESLLASGASLASDGSGRLLDEQTTTRATREAIDTPLDTRGNGHSQASLRKPRNSVQLLGRTDDCPKALTTTIAAELRALLPVQQRLAKSWRLVYSMDQHGISFQTMLSRCEHEKALVLAVKDTSGRVFGAFINEPLRLSPTFYGQGTSFLWKAFRSSPQSRKKDAVKGFKYTGDNEYFILCDPDFVAIGGGRGKFGLWFKSDFLHGYSARCPTFNNEPLCLDPSHPKNKDPDAQQEFVVGHLELWAFNS
ncbi:oxidation resistance protein 1 [Coemansia sp. RSA 2706]|nr:oxidation resistance protein 1 [Coemansia sp. RSA 2706]